MIRRHQNLTDITRHLDTANKANALLKLQPVKMLSQEKYGCNLRFHLQSRLTGQNISERETNTSSKGYTETNYENAFLEVWLLLRHCPLSFLPNVLRSISIVLLSLYFNFPTL